MTTQQTTKKVLEALLAKHAQLGGVNIFSGDNVSGGPQLKMQTLPKTTPPAPPPAFENLGATLRQNQDAANKLTFPQWEQNPGNLPPPKFDPNAYPKDGIVARLARPFTGPLTNAQKHQEAVHEYWDNVRTTLDAKSVSPFGQLLGYPPTANPQDLQAGYEFAAQQVGPRVVGSPFMFATPAGPGALLPQILRNATAVAVPAAVSATGATQAIADQISPPAAQETPTPASPQAATDGTEQAAAQAQSPAATAQPQPIPPAVVQPGPSAPVSTSAQPAQPAAGSAPAAQTQQTTPPPAAATPAEQPAPAPKLTEQQMATIVKMPDADFDEEFKKAPPEVQTQMASARAQHLYASDPVVKKGVDDLRANPNATTPEALAFQKRIDAAGQGALQTEMQNFLKNNPDASQQDVGKFISDFTTNFGNMPAEHQMLAGLGFTLGAIGLISSLFGGGGMGTGLLSALGIGAAGLIGADAGLFGADAQNWVGDMKYSLGQSAGIIPKEKQDLSALLTANPAQDIAAAIAKKTDPFSAAIDPKAYAATKVAPELKKLEQLKQLAKADAGMIQRIGGLKSIQEGELARKNILAILAAAEDTNTPLGKQVAQANSFMADPVGVRNEKAKNVATGAYNLGRYAYNRGADALTSAQQYLLNLNKPENMQQGASDLGAQAVSSITDFFKNNSAGDTSVNIAQQIFAEQFRKKMARCWKGYEPVPGTTPYTDGSCRPAGSKKTKKEVIAGKKKTEKKSAAILAALLTAKTAEFSNKPFDPSRGPQLPGKATPEQIYNHQLRRSREIVQKQQRNPQYVPPGWYAELHNYYGGKMPARPAQQAQPAQPPQTAAVQAVKPAMPPAAVSRPQAPPTTPLKRPTMTQMPTKPDPTAYPSPRNLAGNRLQPPQRFPTQGTR